jgi:PAS domain S-box-containing protein
MFKPVVESLPGAVVDLTEEALIRVLHVDDDADFLNTAKQILEMQSSFQVETARSVEEALEKMKEKTFDVVVSDYVMPGKNGLDFLKELRDSGCNIPFIIFTGKGREEVAIKALNFGADLYFNKFGHPETVYGELAHGICTTVKSKQAEKELRKSENKYRSLVENAGTGIATTDLEGRFIFVNQALCNMTGYSEKELIGKPFADFLHPDDKERVLQIFLDSWKNPDRKLHIEFRVLHKKGHIVHMYSSPTATMYNNKIIGFNAIISDITERKKAEQALRESEEKWRCLTENSPDHIMMLDRDAKILYINRTVPDVTTEEVLGKSVYDYVPSEFHKVVADCFESVLETGKPSSYNTEYHTKEGEIRHFDVRVAPVFQSGKVVGLISHSTDITERKQAEEAVLREKKFSDSLVNSSVDGILAFDHECQYTIWNSGMERISDASRKKVIGKCAFDVFPFLKETRENKFFYEALAGKTVVAKDRSYAIPETGKQGVFEGYYSPIRDEIGEIMGGLAIIRDITERKEAEESLNRIIEELATTNEKLNVVGTLTRHDVRNKLSAVLNNIYLAKKTLTSDHEALKYLGDIESTFDQVGKIFEFARIYEMLGTEELCYVDVSKSVDEAVRLFSDLQAIKVVNDCQGLTVLADSLVRQLCYNLIDNSLKYGEKVSQIRIYHEKVEEQLKLVYEDDGVGIPEAEKEKLFKEGYGKGTGYGLYLIRKMCEIYGWTIQETGKQGKGAQFTITIPKMNKNGKIAYQLH